MDIGSKIKQARKDAGVTQEDAAEALGVSRQTISNWENEKTYPDIISVLKMSDLYQVSLDYLLKGELPMNNYINYLDESTNTVKSRNRLEGLMVLIGYLAIWALAIIVFWCLGGAGDAMGYSLAFIWVILPVTTLVTSFIIGKQNYWGKKKWFLSIGFGVMYMLSEYGTFSTANNVAFNNVNAPEYPMVLVGIIISLIGMGIGTVLYRRKNQ